MYRKDQLQENMRNLQKATITIFMGFETTRRAQQSYTGTEAINRRHV